MMIKKISSIPLRFVLCCVIVTGCVLCIKSTIFLVKGVQLASESPFSNPPSEIENHMLVGVWNTEYMQWGKDTITIKPDGSFQQYFREEFDDSESFEFQSVNGRWWIESKGDGRIYLHLEGAKYFPEGSILSDRPDGIKIPCSVESAVNCDDGVITVPFMMYDWIGDELVDMSNKLILNIRTDSSGELMLVHLWMSSDSAFAIIGGESNIFRKIDDPN